MRISPVLYGLIAPYTVIVAKLPEGSAALTDGSRIFIDVEVAEELLSLGDEGAKALLFTLVHEAIHNFHMHPWRQMLYVKDGGTQRAFNIAADAIVDVYMERYTDGALSARAVSNVFNKIGAEIVTIDEVAKTVKKNVDEVAHMPVETLARLLEKNVRQAQQTGGGGGGGGSNTCAGRQGLNGDMISVEEGDRLAEGGEVAWTGTASDTLRDATGELERALSEGNVNRVNDALDRIARSIGGAYTAAKKTAERIAGSISGDESAKPAGRGKGDADRMAEELTRGVADWRRLLRYTFYAHFGEKYTLGWERPNLVAAAAQSAGIIGDDVAIPGRRQTGGIEEAVFAIDVSGSITQYELNTMASSVLDAVEQLHPRRVTIVFWDDGVREVRRISGRPSRVREALTSSVPGGGGTSITEALRYAERLARRKRGKLVVAFASDWYTSETAGEIAERIRRIKEHGARVAVIATPDYNTSSFEKVSREADLAVKLPPLYPWRRMHA